MEPEVLKRCLHLQWQLSILSLPNIEWCKENGPETLQRLLGYACLGPPPALFLLRHSPGRWAWPLTASLHQMPTVPFGACLLPSSEYYPSLNKLQACSPRATGIYPDFPLDLTGFFSGSSSKHLIQFLVIKIQDFRNFVLHNCIVIFDAEQVTLRFKSPISSIRNSITLNPKP